MRLIKGTLNLSLGWVNDDKYQDFAIEVSDNATDDEINDLIEELWIYFRNEYIQGGWNIESDEIIE